MGATAANERSVQERLKNLALLVVGVVAITAIFAWAFDALSTPAEALTCEEQQEQMNASLSEYLEDSTWRIPDRELLIERAGLSDDVDQYEVEVVDGSIQVVALSDGECA